MHHFKKTNSLSLLAASNYDPIRRQSVEETLILVEKENIAGRKKALEYAAKASRTANGIAGSLASQLNHIVKNTSQSGPSFQEMTYHVTNDPKLWKEFRKELIDSKIVTNVGVKEVLIKFITERKKDIVLGYNGDAKITAQKKIFPRRNIVLSDDVSVRTISSSALSSMSAAASLMREGIQKTANRSMIFTRSLSSRHHISSSTTQRFSEIQPKILVENSSQPNEGLNSNPVQPSLAPTFHGNASKMNLLERTATSACSLANVSRIEEGCTNAGLGLIETWIRRSMVETEVKEKKDIDIEEKDEYEMKISSSEFSPKTMSVTASKASFGKEKEKRSFYDAQFHLRYDPSDKLGTLYDPFSPNYDHASNSIHYMNTNGSSENSAIMECDESVYEGEQDSEKSVGRESALRNKTTISSMQRRPTSTTVSTKKQQRTSFTTYFELRCSKTPMELLTMYSG